VWGWDVLCQGAFAAYPHRLRAAPVFHDLLDNAALQREPKASKNVKKAIKNVMKSTRPELRASGNGICQLRITGTLQLKKKGGKRIAEQNPEQQNYFPLER
jgi:hypothetical protein